MIKNDRQLSVTLSQRAKLQEALDLLAASNDPTAPYRIPSLQADLQKIDEQIAVYQSAVEGDVDTLPIFSVERVGAELVSARIAAGLTQSELAHRLNKKEQQIQRYERNLYMEANLRTIISVASVLKAIIPLKNNGTASAA